MRSTGGLADIDLRPLENPLVGLPIAFLFLLFLLFTAFGDERKYYWAGIAASPVFLLLVYADTPHLYFHILFPLAGWLIGLGMRKLFITVTVDKNRQMK